MSDLDFALALADAADEISMRHFRSRTLVVHTKPDLTPVSDADREVEDALRARVDAERPGDAVLGEEGGETGTGSVPTMRAWCTTLWKLPLPYSAWCYLTN